MTRPFPFARSVDIYHTIGSLFKLMVASDGIGASMRALDLSVLFVISDPPGSILLQLRGDSSDVVFGGSTGSSDVVVSLSAATLHQVLLDEADPYAATADGDISVHGPIGPFMALVPLLQFSAAPIYSAVLAEPEVVMDGPKP